MILPAANEADVSEGFGDGLPRGISVHCARTMDEVLKVVLPEVNGDSTS